MMPVYDQDTSDTRSTISAFEGDSAKERLLNHFRISKRRLVQQVLVKCGKAEESNDTEFQMLVERHNILYRHVKQTMSHMKTYMNSLVAVGYGCNMLGEDAIKYQRPEAAAPAAEKTKTEFSAAMRSLEGAARNTVYNEMINITDMLQVKVDDLKDIKNQIKNRQNLKLDYDSALRKLQSVKDKNQSEDISRREIKLKMAEETLFAVTDSITKRLEYYETIKVTLLDNEMEMFRKAQAKFFALGADIFSQSSILSANFNDAMKITECEPPTSPRVEGTRRNSITSA